MDWSIVSSVIIGAGCVSAVAFWYFRRYFEQKQRHIERVVSDFVSPGSNGAPSAFADLVDIAGQVFARHVGEAFKAHGAGLLSGIARGEKAVDAALLQDTNPMIAGLMEMSPALSKLVKKNPALAGIAMERVGGLIAKNIDGAGNGHGPVGAGNPFLNGGA